MKDVVEDYRVMRCWWVVVVERQGGRTCPVGPVVIEGSLVEACNGEEERGEVLEVLGVGPCGAAERCVRQQGEGRAVDAGRAVHVGAGDLQQMLPLRVNEVVGPNEGQVAPEGAQEGGQPPRMRDSHVQVPSRACAI